MIAYTVEIKNLPELQNLYRQAPEIAGKRLIEAGNKSLLSLQATAKQLSPIDSGRLRQSILVSPMQQSGNTFTGSVGTNVAYACIFDAQTRVTTKEGSKTIGQIQVGDLVLTQAGDYQPVIAKTAFLAQEKPDLIDIEVTWRKGRTHKVTVTRDHKILAFREGRNKWIPAGELVETDLLYHRKKVSPAKGTAKKKTCLWCGQEHQGQGNVYCCWTCKMGHWNSGANPHLGMKRSQETKDKLRQKTVQRNKEHPEKHINRILAQRGRRTAHETEVKQWLDQRGVNYVEQYKVGGHYVDFYLPDTETILEADGSYWHQDQQRDIQRDQEIKVIIKEAKIIHLHFFDKRFSPALDQNPEDGIYYVPCNPGPNSFIDPEQFETAKILSLTEWRYRDEKSHPKDGRMAKLYDLTIANVHSFLANGIVVSNSWMEQGTGIYGPLGRPITPKTKKVLAFMGKGGKMVFSKSVKGVRGRYYMKGSLEQNQRAIDDYFATAADDIARDLSTN